MAEGCVADISDGVLLHFRVQARWRYQLHQLCRLYNPLQDGAKQINVNQCQRLNSFKKSSEKCNSVVCAKWLKGAFAYSWKEPVAFTMSVRPPARPHVAARLPVDGFTLHLKLGTYMEICREIPGFFFLLTPDKSMGHLMWTPTSVRFLPATTNRHTGAFLGVKLYEAVTPQHWIIRTLPVLYKEIILSKVYATNVYGGNGC